MIGLTNRDNRLELLAVPLNKSSNGKVQLPGTENENFACFA
jgi:hypothetical protein